jgi:hypothetical protein
MSNHERWLSIMPNHRVLIAVGTDTHDDLDCLAQVAEMVTYIDEKGLGEKYLQPNLRTEEAGKAAAPATRTT